MARTGLIRLPNVGGGTEEEQLRQIRSYLYQLAEQLQFLLEDPRSDREVGTGDIRDRLLGSPETMDAIAGSISRRYDGRYLPRQAWEPYAAGQEGTLRETALLSRKNAEKARALETLLRQLEDKELWEDPCLIPLYREGTLTGVELGQRRQLGRRITYRRLVRLEEGGLTLWSPEGEKVFTLERGRLRLAPDADGHVTIRRLG